MKYTLAGTKKLAQNLARKIRPSGGRAIIMALQGNLGAGKTTFTQALAKGLGVKEKVNSPTFVIEKIYRLKNKSFTNLIHLDAYRLKSAKDLKKLGWGEIVRDQKNLIILEWPERVKALIPKSAIKIKFIHTGPKHRNIVVGK